MPGSKRDLYAIVRCMDNKEVLKVDLSEGAKYALRVWEGQLIFERFPSNAIIVTPELLSQMVNQAVCKESCI